MIVDQAARNRLIERVQNAQPTAQNQGLTDLAVALQDRGKNNQAVKALITQMVLLNKKLEIEMVDKVKQLNGAFEKNSLSSEELQNLKSLVESVKSKMVVFDEIKEKIDTGQTILLPKEMEIGGEVAVSEVKKMPALELATPIVIPDFPKSMEVYGEVGVDNLPPVTVTNLGEISATILSLQKSLTSTIQALKVKMPTTIDVGNEVQISKWDELIEGIEELKKGFNLLINKEAGTVNFPSTSIPVEIQNWKVAQPATNISINPVRGNVLTTAVTLTAASAALPTTALIDRRSIIIYNNSGVTIYIGGADVTAANGLPVPASSYSPAMDAGPRTLLYGITASGSANVRVLEMNDLLNGGDN